MTGEVEEKKKKRKQKATERKVETEANIPQEEKKKYTNRRENQHKTNNVGKVCCESVNAAC